MKDKVKISQKKSAGSRGASDASKKAAGKRAGRSRPSGSAVRSELQAARAQIDARFRAVFENSRDAIGTSKNGVHVFVNPAYLALFGFPQGTDLAGKPILDLIAPDSRDLIKTYLLRRQRGEEVPSFYETFGLRTDGTTFEIEVNVSSYQENGENITLVILRDVTARKMAEKEISDRGAMLRQIMDTASVAIGLVDKTGRITHANQSMAVMFGRSLDELVGCEYVELVHLSERETARKSMLGLLASDISSVDLERRYWKKDGTEFWGHLACRRFHDSHGKELGLIGVITDITSRMRSEEVLRVSEERFRKVFLTSPDSININRLEDGMFISINHGFTETTGYIAADVIGRTSRELNIWVDPTDRQRLAEGLRKQGEVKNLEARFRLKDGRIIDGLVYASIVEIDHIPHIISVTRDITARKHFESTLKHSEAKYRHLYHNTPILLHSIDRNGIVVDVNDYWLTTMGYDRSEVIGRKITNFFEDSSRIYAEEVIQPAFFRDGGIKDVPYQFIKKNGEVLDVLLSATAERDDVGNVIRSQAVTIDITDRKRMEEGLLRSEERYRDLFENAIDPIVVVDEKQNYLDVNKRAVELFGYSREEFLSMNIRDMLPPEQLPRSEKAFRDLESQGSYQHFTGRIRKKDGTYLDIEVSSSAIVNNGRIVGSRDIIRDISERKRAEEALQKSERMLQTIIDTEPDCIKIIDEESRLIMMNRAGLSMIQADSLDQVKGQFICSMVAPEYQQAFMDLTSQVFKGGSGTLEFRIAGLRGVQLWMETHAVPLRNEKDEIIGLLGVTRDITERKRVEEKISTYSAGLQRLLSISREMTATTDTARLYRIAIQTAVDLLHFDFSTIMVLSEDKSSLMITDSVGFPSSMVGNFYLVEGQGLSTYVVNNRTAETVVDFRTEARFEVPDIVRDLHIRSALCVPMMLEDRVFGVLIGHTLERREFSREDIAMHQSIGNQAAIAIKNAMNVQALRENQEQLDLALQSAHMGVWRWEITENRRYFDDATCQVLGIEAATFTGTVEDFYRAVHPEDRDKLREAIAMTLEYDIPYEPTYRIIWLDGSIHYIASRGRLFRDDKGGPARINGVLWDITETKRMEQEMLKAQKLESIGTLAGGIAHDFNNLLQGVFGFISMARITFDQKEKSLAMLTQAEKALHQSVNLTSQLLTFSKGGKPVKRVFALRPLIENSVALALSGSRVTCELAVDRDIRDIEADEGQIGQVIQNIVLNADQSMPLGGTITISVRNIPAASITTPPIDLKGDLVEIVIRDQGTGIPAEHLMRIFDPYFTTKEKGSGLGLATSYSIIKNHGGLLRVQSEIGKGTTFIIYLPASGIAAEGAKNAVLSTSARTGRVLVMDDEEVIRSVAGELLAALGHEAAFAETGETALDVYQAARTTGSPFDVVILDLTIRGGMGGMEALQRLVEIDPDVKAIVSSGYSDDALMSNYRRHGFRAFLKKPYDLKALQRILDELLA